MKFYKELSKSLVALLVVVAISLANVAAVYATKQSNTGICHGVRNGFIYLEVDGNALGGHLKHGDHVYAGPTFSEEQVISREFKKSKWCNDNVPTASPTAQPTSAPTYQPSPSVTENPTSSPSATASASAEPTSTPTESPTATASGTPDPSSTPTPEESSAPRTDLSDGRSDGHTESLGCQRPQDNCNPAIGGTGGGAELPSTGANFPLQTAVASLVTLTGFGLRKLAAMLS